jgi:hypothetical protein
VIIALGVATADIALGALVVVVFVALLVLRVLEWTDVAGREAPRDEDELFVDLGEPEWWPEFEHRFAEYVTPSRRWRDHS